MKKGFTPLELDLICILAQGGSDDYKFICNHCGKSKNGSYEGLCEHCCRFNNINHTMKIQYEGKIYSIEKDKPKTEDLVLTQGYGIWVFSEKPAPLPYWCNNKTCVKLKLVENGEQM